MFLALGLAFTLMLRNRGTAIGYPAGPTSTPHFVQDSYFVLLPLVDNPPPPASPSYYVTNVISQTAKNSMYNLGHSLGAQDYASGIAEDHLVILDFGYPVSTTTAVGTNLVFDQSPNPVLYTTEDIRSAVTQFAMGFFYGSSSNLYTHLRIVVGTNSCCIGVSEGAFEGHGKAWASMMTYINASLSNYANQVDAVAGSDMEPTFSDPFKTTRWVQNFADGTIVTPCNDATSGRDRGCLYNYGADSVSADSTPCATVIGNLWSGCDVWKVSWGATETGTYVPFARALPEIYHASGSDSNAWSALDAYSINAPWNTPHYGAMYFVGSLTQYARCGDTCSDGNGTFSNNTAANGYDLLYAALNNNQSTQQPLRWSTDIGVQ